MTDHIAFHSLGSLGGWTLKAMLCLLQATSFRSAKAVLKFSPSYVQVLSPPKSWNTFTAVTQMSG
jgi:hypothetical protein